VATKHHGDGAALTGLDVDGSNRTLATRDDDGRCGTFVDNGRQARSANPPIADADPTAAGLEPALSTVTTVDGGSGDGLTAAGDAGAAGTTVAVADAGSDTPLLCFWQRR